MTTPVPTTELQVIAKTAHSTEELLSGDSAILDQLILMFEKGLNQPIIYWQVAVIVTSLILGVILSVYLKKHFVKRYAQKMAEKYGPKGIPPSDTQAEKLSFWETIKRSLTILFLSLSWALFSLMFILLFSVSARMTKLLPAQELPLESMVWLILCTFVVIRTIVFIIHQTFTGGNTANTLDNFLAVTLWAGVALQIVGVLPKAKLWLESTQISLGGANTTLWSLLMAVFTIALALFVAKWLGQLTERWLTSLENLHSNVRVVLIRIMKVVLMVCAILIGLASVGIDITVLGVFGGAIGVGLGFGLQKITSNYISGFIILLDRSIKIGDYVNVGTIEGIVADIKTRYTVVRAFDGSVTIIPNESFVTGNVKNISYLQGPGRTTVSMSVDYKTDVEECIALMTSVVEKQPRVLKLPAPYTLLKEFGDDGIELVSYFWVPDPEKGTASLKSDISRDMLKAFKEYGINIPYPQRDLHIVNMPEITCKFETGKPDTNA